MSAKTYSERALIEKQTWTLQSFDTDAEEQDDSRPRSVVQRSEEYQSPTDHNLPSPPVVISDTGLSVVFEPRAQPVAE